MNNKFFSSLTIFIGGILLIVGCAYDFIYVLFASVCILIFCALQFPFRLEEGWECSCGYDLSFMNTRSDKCPECGQIVVFEWTQNPNDFSRTTTKRLHLTVCMFALAVILFLVYITSVVLEAYTLI